MKGIIVQSKELTFLQAKTSLSLEWLLDPGPRCGCLWRGGGEAVTTLAQYSTVQYTV